MSRIVPWPLGKDHTGVVKRCAAVVERPGWRESRGRIRLVYNGRASLQARIALFQRAMPHRICLRGVNAFRYARRELKAQTHP
jgi:hypothetical protein